MKEPHFKQATIIGLGLIGGSIAAGLRARGLAEKIVAFDQNADSLRDGLARGIIDAAADSIPEAVAAADLVIVCVPILAMRQLLGDLAPLFEATHRANPVVVTDVGSVKLSLLEAARELFGRVPANLVPGHPIAGSEKHGVGAADALLFDQHKVILTPAPETDPVAAGQVAAMWRALGSEVVEMDAAHHDEVLAQTSHLPHLLAFALVDTLSSQGDSLEIFDYAAGGLRDFTRIAASDPVMWRDVFAANRAPVLAILDRYMADLDRLRGLIEQGRTEELVEVFGRAKAARDHFSMLLEQRTKRN